MTRDVGSRWRRDWRVWIGLGALAFSLLTLAATFSLWRNDIRNLPRPDGSYPQEQLHHGVTARLERHVVLKSLAASGLLLFAGSVFLLSVDRPQGRDAAPS